MKISTVTHFSGIFFSIAISSCQPDPAARVNEHRDNDTARHTTALEKTQHDSVYEHKNFRDESLLKLKDLENMIMQLKENKNAKADNVYYTKVMAAERRAGELKKWLNEYRDDKEWHEFVKQFERAMNDLQASVNEMTVYEKKDQAFKGE